MVAPSSNEYFSSRRERAINVAALVVLAVGLGTSLGAARMYQTSRESEARSAHSAAVSNIAQSAASSLRRSTDFVGSLRSTVSARPDMSNAQFADWIEGAGARERHPGGVGFCYAVKVPGDVLPAFRRAVLADPPATAPPGDAFELIPPGRRDYYCLVRLGADVPGSPTDLPLGIDVCAAPVPGFTSKPGESLRAAADSGLFAVNSIDPSQGVFGISAPVYRGDQSPASLDARRRALVGWVSGSFDGTALLGEPAALRSGFSVTIEHSNLGEAKVVVASVGEAHRRAVSREVRVLADGEWFVTVAGPMYPAGPSPTAQAWFVLGVGVCLSTVLYLVIRTLSRARLRALQLVADRTAELQRLLLHDPLTGLANRTLILDRIDHALAQSRRDRSEVAVMFLDLDGFKAVNDELGHAAGDEVLRRVGERLQSLVRPHDTVGRLGGDEFVIIAAGQAGDMQPEVIANRALVEVSRPYGAGEGGATARIGVSIGIAFGARGSADDMLRDADAALYQAKAAGKGRYVVLEPTTNPSAGAGRDVPPAAVTGGRC